MEPHANPLLPGGTMEITADRDKFMVRRIFCIGRNYRAHAAELGHEVPQAPVIFMKPSTSLLKPGNRIPMPSHGAELHHEAEVVLLIGREGKPASPAEAIRFIGGVSIGLDLTLRDVQNRLKAKGLPWELSKAFDGSATVGTFRFLDLSHDSGGIVFRCLVNGQERQRGNTADVIFPFPVLVHEISRYWSLLPGDLIYTGTPEGVSSLNIGDKVTVESELIGSFTWEIGE